MNIALKIAVYDVGFEGQAEANARVDLPIVESVIWTELTCYDVRSNRYWTQLDR